MSNGLLHYRWVAPLQYPSSAQSSLLSSGFERAGLYLGDDSSLQREAGCWLSPCVVSSHTA